MRTGVGVRRNVTLGASVGMRGVATGVTMDGASVGMGLSLRGEADGMVSGTGGVLGARIGIDMDMDMDTLKLER